MDTMVWYEQESEFVAPAPIFYSQTGPNFYLKPGPLWQLATPGPQSWMGGEAIHRSVLGFTTGLLLTYSQSLYEDPDFNYDPFHLHQETSGFIRKYIGGTINPLPQLLAPSPAHVQIALNAARFQVAKRRRRK
jgi:hypothetical protein